MTRTPSVAKITQHQFGAEWVDDDHGEAIMLTQSDEGYCEPQTVLLHPWQLRATCEHFGILPSGDAETHRVVTALARKLVLLKDRCVHLERWLYQHSDTEHADLSYEQTYAEATADLAREFCADLPVTHAKPGGNPAETYGVPVSVPRDASGMGAGQLELA